jgi:hypothetical protein
VDTKEAGRPEPGAGPNEWGAYYIRRGWGADRMPSPEEAASWLSRCDQDELLRFCTQAIDAGYKSMTCAVQNHETRLAHLQAKLDRQQTDLEPLRQDIAATIHTGIAQGTEPAVLTGALWLSVLRVLKNG